MAVFRVARTRDFTVMSNFHLKDRSLSLKSKGLLTMILSLPDEWNYTTRGLAAICKEGVDSIGSALRELEGAGYITRRRLRDTKGKITDTEYTIYERPQKPNTDGPHTGAPDTLQPYTGNPYADKQDMGAPCTDNTAQLNINQAIPKKSNTHGLNIPSINPMPSRKAEPIDRMEAMDSYRELVCDNIEYSHLCRQYGAERVDEVVELMLETVCSTRESIRVAGDEYPREVVKSRLLKLDQFRVEYVFDCLDRNTTKVHNIKAYLLTALYNAPATMDSYYRAEVNHDLRGGGEI